LPRDTEENHEKTSLKQPTSESSVPKLRYENIFWAALVETGSILPQNYKICLT